MNKSILLGLLICFCIGLAGCQPEAKKAQGKPALEPQAISLTGEPLFVPERTPEQTKRLMNKLEEAQSAFSKDPNEINTIWLGRRYAYLTDYKKAIEVFTEGISRFPSSYRLYRHRGHRNVSIRQFDQAIADFAKAYEYMPKDVSETEPDGIPNKLNQPLSNTQFNILYHYALAHYLKGEFDKAEVLYKECMEYSGNPDLQVATTDWLYMTLRRQGKEADAAQLLESINGQMQIIENDSYYKRLMMYKGELAMEELFKTDAEDAALSLATQGYGVANWYLYNGDTTKANEIYVEILKAKGWSPFGYIAAEADFKMIN